MISLGDYQLQASKHEKVIKVVCTREKLGGKVGEVEGSKPVRHCHTNCIGYWIDIGYWTIHSTRACWLSNSIFLYACDLEQPCSTILRSSRPNMTYQ